MMLRTQKESALCANRRNPGQARTQEIFRVDAMRSASLARARQETAGRAARGKFLLFARRRQIRAAQHGVLLPDSCRGGYFLPSASPGARAARRLIPFPCFLSRRVLESDSPRLALVPSLPPLPALLLDLLVTQRHHGIHAHRAARGQNRGNQSCG